MKIKIHGVYRVRSFCASLLAYFHKRTCAHICAKTRIFAQQKEIGNKMTEIIKYAVAVAGGAVGWLVNTFEPAFPLLAVAYGFILWDVQSAWALDKRAHIMYPDKVKRERANFTSLKFGRVVDTFIKATSAIILMFAARKWVCVGLVDIPLDYIAAGVVLAWQGLSVLENNASCPLPGDHDTRFWKLLRRVLIDKTERHLDIALDEIKNNDEEENS